MRIDAHHHLWELTAVSYPWLEAKGEPRFFGDPASIQRDYLLPEFRADAEATGFQGSVHIQVGAADGLAEAHWVDSVATANPDWPLVQVAFCDLAADNREEMLDQLQTLPSLRGIRQIVGRAPEEDAATGTNSLIDSPAFREGLQSLAQRGLSFDLQLIPELMESMAALLSDIPALKVALCHAGSPWDRSATGIASWQERLKTLSALPHVTCKLSGLGMFDHDWTIERFRPLVETCLDQFGPDRLMVGSNFPVDSLTSDYRTLFDCFTQLTKHLGDADRASIFGGTATKFYRMDAK